jgi:SPASM domain peptide maturase of grasp-with-spasm system
MIKNLASNCFFVKGYKMNLLFDAQNNAWYHLLDQKDDLVSGQIEQSKKEYLQTQGIVIEYPDFLKDSLPEVNLEYSSPQVCESIIIDWNSKSSFDLVEVLNKFDFLNLQSAQLRFFDKPNPSLVFDVVNLLDSLTLESVELITPYDTVLLDLFEENQFLARASKVFRVFMHSVSIDENFRKSNIAKIYYTAEQIRNDSCCGQISPFNFSQNPKHFYKSQNFNTCLYKKIGIDVNGDIKNCPSLSKKINNVNNPELEIDLTLFSSDKIKKDEIEVCRDCEFRHVCTDCRAFTDSTTRQNARPSKCNYNPYIAKWPHEEGYRALAECGVISNENEFSIDHEKIAEINKELWGDE